MCALTSSGQITSLKFRRSSGSEKLMSHVLGKFSSFMSGFAQQERGQREGKGPEIGKGRKRGQAREKRGLWTGVSRVPMASSWSSVLECSPHF
jgi:hypothetical protein